MNDGNRKKDEGEDEDNDPKRFTTYKFVGEVCQETILYNVEKVEIEVGDGVEDFVVIAINKLSYNAIT